MTDEELVKRLRDPAFGTETSERLLMVAAADRIEALTAERDEHWKSFVHWRKEADDLTEQLEAARADAKEAEAYAEGLEKEIELNEQEACMLEDDFIKADKQIDALKANLAAAVDWFETIRDRAKGDYMAHTYYLDALAALATIEKSNAP